MTRVLLEPIDQSGNLAVALLLPPFLRDNCAAMASFYKKEGFLLPWIGYVAVAEGCPVGGGAFKGPPLGGKVEIAYYSVPEREGRGYATAIGRELIQIAKTADPMVLITAQTLPEQNASTSVLKKLGFFLAGTATDPDVGAVWEWHLA